jgi:DNA-binding CsgD family transcriptional regulator
MDELEPQFLIDVIGHIYEAAADPDHWQELVTMLERAYPHSRVTLFAHEQGQPLQKLSVSKNFNEDDLKAYAEHHITTSPYVPLGYQLPIGVTTKSESMVSDRILKKTEHYNEYVKPRGLGHYATGMVIERGPNRMVALSLADQKNDETRRARQFKLMETLGPHLMRAFRLRRAFATQAAAANATKAALDRWVHAALVLNSDGSIVAINHAAELLLRRSDGLRLGRDGQLRCADDIRTRALNDAIRKCAAISAGVEANAAEIDGVALPRPSGAAALRAMMWPLPFLGGSSVADYGSASVLMVIFDPDQMQRTPVGWLAQQYGLTPSEQRLTEAIINGVPLSEAAEQLGIRESTARTRLKIIQAKTDCHRQVDLVRLALSLPALRQDDRGLMQGSAGEAARTEDRNQSGAGKQSNGDDREHGQRAGAFEQWQQGERNERGYDPVDRPGRGTDNSADPGRKSLRSVDTHADDVDRAQHLEDQAGRHQQKRRVARGER